MQTYVYQTIKEELAWAADKWLWIISTTYNVIQKQIAIRYTMELK